eukprot:TRINITY_DN48861_c0_g1_i1.p1 TRINITY_DN48861_c0_g1~~TRINITY_DN48861_c0_g1_i1.p1  ORF type:complete len:233 (+),score=39.01 TRINITY_DN48861_c0_g1_i1:109-807(+)
MASMAMCCPQDQSELALLKDISPELQATYRRLKSKGDEGAARIIDQMTLSAAKKQLLMEMRMTLLEKYEEAGRRRTLWQVVEFIHLLCTALVPILIPLSKAYADEPAHISWFGHTLKTDVGDILSVTATSLAVIGAITVALHKSLQLDKKMHLVHRQFDEQIYEFDLYLAQAGPYQYESGSPESQKKADEQFADFIQKYQRHRLENGYSRLFMSGKNAEEAIIGTEAEPKSS